MRCNSHDQACLEHTHSSAWQTHLPAARGLVRLQLRQVITAPQMALPEGYRQAAHRLHNATEKAAPLLQDLITAPFVVKGHVGCQKVQ